MSSFLGRLDLVLKPSGGVETHQWKMIPLAAEQYPEDPQVKRLVDAALKPYRERMGQVVGHSQTPADAL